MTDRRHGSKHQTAPRLVVVTWLVPVAIAVAAVALAQQAPPFDPIPAASVDQAQKAFAQKVAHDTLTAWKAGRFQPLDGRFDGKMRSALPPEKQRGAYQAIKATFGDYQSMTFHEALRSKSGTPPMTVYRFRGSFTKTSTSPEVRVVIDGQGKVAGFFVLAWFDQLR